MFFIFVYTKKIIQAGFIWRISSAPGYNLATSPKTTDILGSDNQK